MDEDIFTVLTLVLVFIAGVISTLLYLQVVNLRVDGTVSDRVSRDIDIDFEYGDPTGVKTNLVAVDNRGVGTISPIWVDADYGTGRILVNIENLFFWLDTQYSIRLASLVGLRYLDLDKMDYDLTYYIITTSREIGGPSAGAPMAVATVAALKNKTLNEDVIMTGTINEDMSIGRVGGIYDKAEAAAESGFDKFLVPSGQSVQVVTESVFQCDYFRGVEICREEIVTERVNISEEFDIDVVEVSDLEEALTYYIDR